MKKTYENLNFTQEEIQRLHKRFLKMDTDKSGALDKEEFLRLPQIENNPLANRLIDVFDKDNGGTVDFEEFLQGLSIFSVKGRKDQKLKFLFQIYDINNDGFITNGELFDVLKMMTGSNLRDVQLQQIVDKTIIFADLDRDGKISLEEFTKMVERTNVLKQLVLNEF